MFVDFCELDYSEKNPTVRLDTVYHVSADGSYQVHHPPLPEEKFVLLITDGGNGYIKSRETELEMESGDVLLFVPDREEFDYHTVGEEWDFWWFAFYGEEEEKTLPERNRLYRVNPDIFLKRQCKTCLSLLRQEKASAASAVLGGILADILQQTAQIEEKDEKAVWFRKAQQKIHQELGTITVAQVAAYIGIGERELRSLFWKQAGTAPKKYIMSSKLEVAGFLLKNTNKSIGEISEELGFSSQFHFSRVFKTWCGTTPNDWRKQ